ncbi:hypothetical protein [uncultured Trichococcus sp.]|uniref:hypothetical protein n=1 Tax=uncultured Trichococcus sp. TaxID=189665 RepID=UPI0029C689F3|nr:hypothetical protein [uncultured Trichococcus sp.]
MRLMQKGIWREKLDVADLLEQKGCYEFTLLEDKLSVRGELFEIWWYAYDGNNHILAKSKRYPTRLYFFLLELGDLFAVDDFRIYLETGKLKYPVAKYYNKNGR